MGAFHAEETAAVLIAIDVNDAFGSKLVFVGLHPFGRSQESWLFAIPAAVDHGAFGPPTFLGEFADASRLLQERYCSAERVLSASDPAVVVVAADHPLIGQLRTRQLGITAGLPWIWRGRVRRVSS